MLCGFARVYTLRAELRGRKGNLIPYALTRVGLIQFMLLFLAYEFRVCVCVCVCLAVIVLTAALSLCNLISLREHTQSTYFTRRLRSSELLKEAR